MPAIFGCGGLFGSDDVLEDNDASPAASAAALPFNEGSLRVCPTDDDWYSFPVTAGNKIQVDAFFTGADGDVDIFLHDPSDAHVDASFSVDDDESISYVAAVSGTYRVRVHLFSSEVDGNVYSLQISTATTDTPTPTRTRTPTPTLTPEVTFTPTNTPTHTATPTATVTNTPTKPIGDVNDDGSIDSIDAALILQYLRRPHRSPAAVAGAGLMFLPW